MPSLSEVKAKALLTMLKGEPGTRKSTQALSYPLPQYWFSTDQKMDALLIPAKLWGIDRTKITYDDYSGSDISHSWNQMLSKMESFQLSCPYRDGTIIIDSITSTGDVINLQTLELTKGTSKKDGEAKGRRIGGIAVDTFDEYKAEKSAFRDMLSTLMDIRKAFNVNIVLIAHVIGERKVDEIGITHHARVIITGGKAISGNIAAYCHETYHFNVTPHPDPSKPGSFKIRTTHTGADYARTALPLPLEIDLQDKPLYDTWIRPAIIKLNE